MITLTTYSSPELTINQAKEMHEQSAHHEELATDYRIQRDELIVQLRIMDREVWTYSKISRAIGCSAELVALICRKQDARIKEAWENITMLKVALLARAE